ncbi:MAG: hypothetical protein LBU34_15955 [Planctomycetaceae bacterium]|jgi:predicted nucleic acid-binding protein|nr:hypothetical protein [Planctomycetaceae bacterium]
MRIYLDNCCYNRPYDDQRQIRIHLETEAKLHIQEMIKDGKIELVCSFVSRFENSENSNIYNKDSIERFFQYAVEYINDEFFDDILFHANELRKQGIKIKDAAHLACAIKAKCDYFVTTDNRFLNRYNGNEIVICNPLTLLQIIERENNAKHKRD